MTGYNAGPLALFDETPPGLKRKDLEELKRKNLIEDVILMITTLAKVKSHTFETELYQPMINTIRKMSDEDHASIAQSLADNHSALTLFLKLSKQKPARCGFFF